MALFANAQMEARLSQVLAARRPRIILGTQSSSRRQIMNELSVTHTFTYDTCTADIDEKAIRMSQPRDLVLTLAHAKASAIIDKLRARGDDMSGFLLTCDQVVVHEERILEKPASAEEARGFIRGYGRSPASTVGSVVCTDLSTGQTFEDVDTAHIYFNPIPEESIDKLIQEGDCMYCAGGLMVEHPLVAPHVTRMEGTQDSVMGLNKASVIKLLVQALGG